MARDRVVGIERRQLSIRRTSALVVVIFMVGVLASFSTNDAMSAAL